MKAASDCIQCWNEKIPRDTRASRDLSLLGKSRARNNFLPRVPLIPMYCLRDPIAQSRRSEPPCAPGGGAQGLFQTISIVREGSRAEKRTQNDA